MAGKLSLMDLFDLFAEAMKERLKEKADAGWIGWNNKIEMKNYKGGLERRIIQNVLDGHWADVANLAMFAWNFER